MNAKIDIIGGGLAGSEAALQLAARGVRVRLLEMRPSRPTPVHASGDLAELVCSNSLKSTKPDSAAGMLKHEMAQMDSFLLATAQETEVAAGGALAVDRQAFAHRVTAAIDASPLIERVEGECLSLDEKNGIVYRAASGEVKTLTGADALVIASGPMTSDAFASFLEQTTGRGHLSFYDAAAPIVMADSLDMNDLFRQGRYEDEGQGDYLNAPFTKAEYESFIAELLSAKRVIAKDFETKELFRACQPIEEIARRGFDAPRHGTMKPVGLVNPHTGKRPWAAVQLRAENAEGTSYNLVGFQTNLTFPEQDRVFRMIPGFAHAEFARHGVMHRNTFIDAPHLLDRHLRLRGAAQPIFFAGQVGGTEGYCEAIMSGAYAALCAYAAVVGIDAPVPPKETSFGSLLAYATDPTTVGYQPMHVNFGVIPPFDAPIKNKRDRYAAFAKRAAAAMDAYGAQLQDAGLAIAAPASESDSHDLA